MANAEDTPSAIADPLPLQRTGVMQSRWNSAEGLDMGGISALIPLTPSLPDGDRSSATLFFAEPYGQWVEGGPHQTGIGFGFRQLHGAQSLYELTETPKFFDEGFYVGANVFFDRANTQSELNLWQLSLGAEAGTRWVDLRGRYHFPIGDGKTTQQRSVSTFTHTSETNGVESNQTLTFDSTLSLFTESLGGWEADAAFLVPGIDRWVDLRILAGYAAFQSPTVDFLKSETWRTGIDFRPVPAVSLSAIWNENEALFGANWVYGAGVQIPFEINAPGTGACGTRGGFWGAIKESFRPHRSRLAERFLEPTRRNPLPMQIGTSIQGIETTATYTGTLTRPDGSVERVSASQSAHYSGASIQTVAPSSAAGFGVEGITSVLATGDLDSGSATEVSQPGVSKGAADSGADSGTNSGYQGPAFLLSLFPELANVGDYALPEGWSFGTGAVFSSDGGVYSSDGSYFEIRYDSGADFTVTAVGDETPP